MLTGEAFNALLKTLEEPPRYAAFVLATTEAHKVPPTIASRCQRFDFRRLGRETIRTHLARVAREKGWEVDAGALSLLSRQAGGALRDALGLLDQAASYGGGRITREDVEALTGALREDLLEALVSAVGRGDVPTLLNHLESLFTRGYEPRQLLFQLTDYARDLLFAAGTLDPEGNKYAALLRGLAAAEGEMKGSSRPDLILELALLRLAGERLETHPPPGDVSGLAGKEARRGRQGGVPGRNREQVAKKGEGAAAEDPEALKSILCARFQDQPLLAQVLTGCKFEREGNKIMVTPPSSFAHGLLQKEENRRVLQEVVKQCGGGALGLEFSPERAESKGPGFQSEAGWARHQQVRKNQTGTPDRGEQKPGARKDQEDPGGDPVGMALSLFKGEIITQAEAEGD
jgi:hypothetical protein